MSELSKAVHFFGPLEPLLERSEDQWCVRRIGRRWCEIHAHGTRKRLLFRNFVKQLSQQLLALGYWQRKAAVVCAHEPQCSVCKPNRPAPGRHERHFYDLWVLVL